jgi:hypothetical protein
MALNIQVLVYDRQNMLDEGGNRFWGKLSAHIIILQVICKHDMNAALHCYYNQYVYDAEHMYMYRDCFIYN